IQLRRDRRMIPVLIIGPMVQLLALGFAANTDVTDVPALVVDLDRTSASRDLVHRFEGSGYFEVVGSEDSVLSIDPWLLRGRAQVALVIGAGYGEALAGGGAPAVQVIADGTDATSAVQGLGYATRIIAGLGGERLQGRLREAARRLSADGGAP